MRKSFYLLIANYLYMAGVGVLSPVYALYVLNIGGNAFTAGLSWAIYLILAGIIMMFVANYQDKGKHIKKYILIGYGLAALSTFGYLFIRTVEQLYMLQVIHAIGIGILTPALRTAYTRMQDKSRQSREWALFDGGIFILQGVTSLIGGLIVILSSFSVLFIFMGLLQVISIIVIMRLKTD